MPNICLIYTDTNGLHKTNENVSSKNLYKFARVIAIHYMVGTYNEGNFKELFTKHIILKPKTINFDKDAQNIHNITIDEATKYGVDNITAINELKKDLSDIKIIISHNLPFHIKALQVECFRTAIEINFSKYILIDLISFGHKLSFPKLSTLIKTYKITSKNQLNQYLDLFLILYSDYIKSSENITNEDECDFVD
jgi:DNA polymerase III epsilon subunit-like protein